MLVPYNHDLPTKKHQNDSTRNFRGFTLIELLVVIAIIGILASVVLSSLNNARDGASDSAVQSNLQTVRTQAELYHSILNTYGTVAGTNYVGDCATLGTMFRLSPTSGTAEQRALSSIIDQAIQKASQAGSGLVQCRLDGSRQNYMVAVQLKTSNAYWCVDNLGTSKRINSLPATGVVACE